MGWNSDPHRAYYPRWRTSNSAKVLLGSSRGSAPTVCDFDDLQRSAVDGIEDTERRHGPVELVGVTDSVSERQPRRGHPLHGVDHCLTLWPGPFQRRRQLIQRQRRP